MRNTVVLLVMTFTLRLGTDVKEYRFLLRLRVVSYTRTAPTVSRDSSSVLLLLVLAVFAVGCAGPRSTTEPSTAARPSFVAHDPEARIRAVVDDWHGAPHVLGGTGRSGLDCSAFMQVVYRDVYRLDLPRSTELQVHEGRTVHREQLRAGDLVFFRPGRKQRHVGVYLSDDEFAHVSSSQGVTISNLDDTYWRRAYWTARRLAGEAPVAEGRVGW